MSVNYTPSRSGLIQGGSDNDALFYKLFSGEVIKSFEENNIMASRHMVKTISNGKSASFEYTGKLTAGYHVAGKDAQDPANGLVQTLAKQEKIITIDDVLTVPVFKASIDELKEHYSDRQIVTKEMGAALAREFDKKLLRVGALGAVAAAKLTGSFDGGNYEGGSIVKAGASIDASDSSFDVADALAAIESLAATMDEKDVPLIGRFLALKPRLYRALVNSGAVDTDFNPEGNGSIASGKIYRVQGFELLTTNNLPSGTIAGVTGENNTYSGTFTGVEGLAWTQGAIGTVKLQDITYEQVRNAARNGYEMYARMAVGHGYLNAAAIGLLSSQEPT